MIDGLLLTKDGRLVRKILSNKKEQAQDINIYKLSNNIINIEFVIKGYYNVEMTFNEDMELTQLFINYNYYTGLLRERDFRKAKEWGEYFFETSKDRLRLLFWQRK